MSSEWPIVTLSDAGITLIDCDHKTPKAQDSGFPYVGIPQLKDGRIILDDARLISEEDFNHWRRKAKPQPHDVILSRRCNPGKSAYVPENLEVALGQNLVLLRADGEKVHPPFLRWLTQGDKWWEQVSKFINVGAVFDSLKCADIPKFEFKLPPKFQQERISSILSEIDNKVIINTRINETLEEIAQALFKSWFVDFDPVKAKMEALAAGGSQVEAELAAMRVISAKTAEELKSLEENSPEAFSKLQETASLFPSAMQESELGLIPKGWSYCTFGDVSACFDSKRIPLSKRKREEKQPGDIPYYGATSIMDYVNEWIFDDTFLLLGEDGSVVKEDGTPFIQYIWGRSWVNNHAHVLQGDNGISTEHLLVFMRTKNIASYVTGAVQLKLNQRNMNSIPFLKASTEVNLVFQKMLVGLYDAFKNNVENSKALSLLRDSLLPKLLSGEIELQDKE